jgi:bacillithiol synthase
MYKMTRFYSRSIPFGRTGFFSKLILDYLAESQSLKRFYYQYPSREGISDLLNSFESIHNREVLVSVLSRQYNGLKAGTVSNEVIQNIERLKDKTTFTVTTGHQLNFFSGPLYLVYKLLSTIKLAQTLCTQFPEKHFVPVYWMASEDHDIAEINNLTLFNKRLEYQTDYNGPAGNLKLDKIGSLIDEIKSLGGTSESNDALIDQILSSYKDGTFLSDATRDWINHFFGKYGLIILDPSDKELKQSFIATMKDDLFNHTAFKNVTETISDLKKEGYDVQVQPREINLFYLYENKRSRIVREKDKFQVLESAISFSEEEILSHLNEFPERFSPNVVLRPLYQQTILPNIAYVGGPAEIAYWLEYGSMFRSYKVNYPVLFLRNCMLIADGNLLEKFHRLGFSTEELFEDEEVLIKKYLANNSEGEFNVNKYAEKFSVIFEELNSELNDIDPTLRSSAESEKQRLSNALKQLEQKIIRALKRKNETEVNQIRKVKDRFFPGKELQERTETMLPFLMKYGENFISAIYDQVDPYAKQFHILLEEPVSQ